MTIELDIVVPVYNESANIHRVLGAFEAGVRSAFRVLVVYDRDDDDTLAALRAHAAYPFEVRVVKNRGRGVFGAVTTGFSAATAAAILVWPADDDYNAARIDGMVERMQGGCDIVAASRFMPGGRMVGCPWLKDVIVRSSAFVLHHVARVPTHDPSKLQFLYAGTDKINMSGGPDVAAMIVAPNAAVEWAGGGDFYGAMIVKTMNVKGNFEMHYDRALGRRGVGETPANPVLQQFTWSNY